MSDGMFRTVSGLKQGYDPDEVDDFFAHARAVYEQGPAAALASKDVRGVAFDMVRGGYVTAAVDAALDRLEAAFVARSRAEFIATQGQQAWMDQPERAGPHAVRPAGPSRRRPVRRRRTVGSRATSRPTSTSCASASSPTSTRARRCRPPRSGPRRSAAARAATPTPRARSTPSWPARSRCCSASSETRTTTTAALPTRERGRLVVRPSGGQPSSRLNVRAPNQRPTAASTIVSAEPHRAVGAADVAVELGADARDHVLDRVEVGQRVEPRGCRGGGDGQQDPGQQQQRQGDAVHQRAPGRPRS